MREINIEKMKKRADNGDIDAMNDLIICYRDGLGVPADERIALSYLKKAAYLGSSFAITGLAVYYSQGRYVDKDIKLALNLFHSAACQGEDIVAVVFKFISKEELYNLVLEGYAPAEYYYAFTLEDNDEERIAYLSSASSKKLAMATCILAMRSLLANPSVTNFEAKNLFLQALDNGMDYCAMINGVTFVEKSLDSKKDINFCDIVREFIKEKYERPFILVKVTGQKWAEKFVNNGEVFFRSLNEFRKIDKSGAGDIYEGISNTKNASSFWDEIDSNPIYKYKEVGMYDEYMAHEKECCFYALEYSKNGKLLKPDIRMRQFGDTVVVINDANEFFRRLKKELYNKFGKSIWIGHKRVNYNVVFSKAKIYNEFSKTESYAWQNEYRFIVDIANGRIERTEWDRKLKKDSKNIYDNLDGMTDFAKLIYCGKLDLYDDKGNEVISIGNIKDICDIYSIDDFIELNENITKNITMNPINDSYDESNHHRVNIFRPFIKL